MATFKLKHDFGTNRFGFYRQEIISISTSPPKYWIKGNTAQKHPVVLMHKIHRVMVERPKVYSEHMLNRRDGSEVLTSSIEQGVHLPRGHYAQVYRKGFSIIENKTGGKEVLHGERGETLATIAHKDDGVHITFMHKDFGEVH